MSVCAKFSYRGVEFHILASAEDKDHPRGYDFGQSIEGRILKELSELSFEEDTDERDDKEEERLGELTRLAEEASLPLIRKLGPAVPLPQPRTIQELLYPEIQGLQILTEASRLTARKIDSYTPQDNHPPISELKLSKQGGLGPTIPVFKASDVVLGKRLQSFVWSVNVSGEKMICKVSTGSFFNIVGDELATYQKLRKAAATSSHELRAPELKGMYPKKP